MLTCKKESKGVKRIAFLCSRRSDDDTRIYHQSSEAFVFGEYSKRIMKRIS